MSEPIQYVSDVYDRWRVSYGAWLMLCQMLDPLDFLNLQQLCRYAYNTSISRCQNSFFCKEELFYAQTSFIGRKFSNSLFAKVSERN